MKFALDKSQQIVIYGVSAMAISWLEKAVLNGFRIKLLVDRNAEKINNVQNIPVINFETYCKKGNKNDVVIIMLQNVMWHEEIVKNLNNIGIKKIVFFPMRDGRGVNKDNTSSLRRKYHECIKFYFSNSIEEIPIIDYSETYNGNEGMIWTGKEECVLWAPIEICYSIEGMDNGDIWKSDYTKETIQLCEKFLYNKNMFNVYPYWELLSFLRGERDTCSLYLKIFGKEGHINSQNYDNEVLLKDRNGLIEIFKEKASMGNSFFEESPADSGVGKLGRVVIYDGMHRSIFLIDRGFYWIPIRLNNQCYKYLYNKKDFQKIRDYLRQNHISELQYPIEGLGFYGFPVQHRFIRQIWKFASQAVSGIGWHIKSVLDLSMTDGYFSRMFYREGVNKIHCYIGNDSKLPMMINRLFRIDDIKMVSNQESILSNENQYELTIINWDKLEELGSISLGVQYMQMADKLLVYGICKEEEGGFGSLLKKRNRVLVNKYIDDGKLKSSWLIY